MTDIVKRLRDGAEYWKTIQASFEMTRAADRIEALEGEVAQLRRERHEAIEDAKASGRSYDEVLVTKEALRDELKAAEARAERLEGEVAKVKSERDKWHKAFLQTGACRACVNGWPDPHGCSGHQHPNHVGGRMTDIVKGMARVHEDWLSEQDSTDHQGAMCAALLWLADNVSDEMVRAAWEREFGRGGFDGDIWRKTIKSAIAAAIHAAAGEEG